VEKKDINMGWSIQIKTDKPVTDEVVRACVKEMPKCYHGPFGPISEQEWGWSMLVDVQKPSKCPESLGWYISGAWFSVKEAEPFSFVLKLLLEKRGFKVTLGEIS
jgi:hypothetical protein